MTILPQSRYTSGEVLWVNTKKRGNKQTVYLNTVVELSQPYTVAILRETDAMAHYAYRAYGDPNRWWTIADINPQIFYPFDIIPGAQMRVPT